MAELHACDICSEILKRKRYLITIQEVDRLQQEEMYSQINNYKDLFNQMAKDQGNIIFKELCPACYKVFTGLLQIRLSKLNKLKQQVDKMEQFFDEGGNDGE